MNTGRRSICRGKHLIVSIAIVVLAFAAFAAAGVRPKADATPEPSAPTLGRFVVSPTHSCFIPATPARAEPVCAPR